MYADLENQRPARVCTQRVRETVKVLTMFLPRRCDLDFIDIGELFPTGSTLQRTFQRSEDQKAVMLAKSFALSTTPRRLLILEYLKKIAAVFAIKTRLQH